MSSNEPEAKERILKVAETLFHQQGYNQTGINQVIKEANVAKASLYYHFPSKEDLCLAFLKRRHESWSEGFEAFLNGKADKIAAAFDFLLQFNDESDFRGCSFLNMLSETKPEKTDVFKALQHHKKSVLNFFETQLHDYDEGVAYTIYSLYENAIIESQLYRSQEPVHRLKGIALRMLNK